MSITTMAERKAEWVIRHQTFVEAGTASIKAEEVFALCWGI